MNETRKAFKIAYLIGISEDVISREFVDHYRETKKGNYFKNYKDVEVVRALNRARQNIIRYNHLYADGMDVTEVTNKQMDKEMNLLKGEGLDLDYVYLEYGQKNYINILTKLIDRRIVDVMGALEVPEPDLIKGIFYFPEFKNDKDFETYLKEQHSTPRPHGSIIYNGYKVTSVISYIFNSNYNLYATASSIQCRKTLTLGDKHNKDFKWKKERLVEPHTTLKLEEVLKELRLYDSTAEMVVGELPEELLTSDKGCLGVYVDTRSIDSYKLISYLEIAYKDEKIGVIRVYGDKQENEGIRGIIPHIIPGIEVEYIEDEWSTKRDNKRVVGMVADIVKGKYTKGIEKAVIFSENRLVEGLIRQEEELEYVICMEGTDIDTKYKEYLEQKGIEVVDFSNIDGGRVLQAYKGKTFKYQMAKTLTEIPINEWDMLSVSEVMGKKGVVQEMGYTESDILNKVEELIKKVEIKVTKGKKYVILEEEKIEIQ